MDYSIAALITGAFVIIMFSCGAIYGFIGQAQHRKRVKSDQYAEVAGKVVDFRTDSNLKGHNDDRIKYAICEYTARDGKTYRYCLQTLGSSRLKINDTVNLVYQIDDPIKCEPRDSYTGLIIGLVLLGCVFAFIYGAFIMGGFQGL